MNYTNLAKHNSRRGDNKHLLLSLRAKQIQRKTMAYLAGDARGKQINSTQPKTSEIEEILDEVDIKFRSLKIFDKVSDPSDHHYYQKRSRGSNIASIKTEWEILETELNLKAKLKLPGYSPIYVRVYEEEKNVDLMKAVVVGPRGTPYCHGLFFFDIWFPPDYPNTPPRFYYYSDDYDINPNLCKDGRVRLTLLKTWSGDVKDQWVPNKSNVLQVLKTIRTSVLCVEPYFNNPDVKREQGRRCGEINSRRYNNKVFTQSCMKMGSTLSNPPKNFEDLVKGHFRNSSHEILMSETARSMKPVALNKASSSGSVIW